MLYEDQAADFDERAAIPAEAVEAVAAAVAEIAGLRRGDTILEIGAGTGMLSLPLIGRSIRYIGFDLSPAMLAVFREKVEEAGLCAELLVADGNRRWSAEDANVRTGSIAAEGRPATILSQKRQQKSRQAATETIQTARAG